MGSAEGKPHAECEGTSGSRSLVWKAAIIWDLKVRDTSNRKFTNPRVRCFSFFFFSFPYSWANCAFACFGAIKGESEDELNPAGNKQILQVLFFILLKPQVPPTQNRPDAVWLHYKLFSFPAMFFHRLVNDCFGSCAIPFHVAIKGKMQNAKKKKINKIAQLYIFGH